MTKWIKKIHMYLGLLNFTILMVFGVAGLTATLKTPQPQRQRPEPTIEFRDFKVPPNLNDVQAAAAAYDFLKTPVSGPFQKNGVHRDSENHVSFNVFSQTGVRTVTLLEKDNRIRLDTRKNSIWNYMNEMHTTTINSRSQDLRIRMWTWYTEFSIWSLILMAASGVYLWLASRPGYRWAQISFAAGSGAFLLLYAITR